MSLQPQVARHGADELNWVEIWLAEMIRQESYDFFLRLLDGGALETLIGVGYQITQHRRRTNRNDTGIDENADITKLINEVGGINERQTGRLIELVNATRKLAGLQLAYNWRFALRPEAVTWKEFGELLLQWQGSAVSQTILAWVTRQSAANSIAPEDVENELFDTLLSATHNAASKAAEAVTVEENAKYCVEAQSMLKMTEQFLSLPRMFTPERFGKTYEKSLHWIAFQVNPADRELRKALLQRFDTCVRMA